MVVLTVSDLIVFPLFCGVFKKGINNFFLKYFWGWTGCLFANWENTKTLRSSGLHCWLSYKGTLQDNCCQWALYLNIHCVIRSLTLVKFRDKAGTHLLTIALLMSSIQTLPRLRNGKSSFKEFPLEEELCLQVVPWAACSTLQWPRPGGLRTKTDSATLNAEALRGKEVWIWYFRWPVEEFIQQINCESLLTAIS